MLKKSKRLSTKEKQSKLREILDLIHEVLTFILAIALLYYFVKFFLAENIFDQFHCLKAMNFVLFMLLFLIIIKKTE